VTKETVIVGKINDKGDDKGDDVDHKEVFRDLMQRMAMDRDNTVDSFEEMGLTDPIESQVSLVEARKVVSNLEFETSAYPLKVICPIYKDVIDHPYDDVYTYPKCIFMPSRALLRKIFPVMVKFASQESDQEFLLRFGLLENPISYYRQGISLEYS